MPYRPLTKLAHDLLRPLLKPGDIAVDATAGNGYDTQFLAGCVGPSGLVYAVDVQETSLTTTAVRLTSGGISWATHPTAGQIALQKDSPEPTVKLIRGDHAAIAGIIASEHRSRVAAVVFNLGYLPGGDKSIRTSAPGTVQAIEGAVDMLKPGGALSVLVYRGHEGGAEEYAAVARCLRGLAHKLESSDDIAGSDASDSPILLFRRRRSQ